MIKKMDILFQYKTRIDKEKREKERSIFEYVYLEDTTELFEVLEEKIYSATGVPAELFNCDSRPRNRQERRRGRKEDDDIDLIAHQRRFLDRRSR